MGDQKATSNPRHLPRVMASVNSSNKGTVRKETLVLINTLPEKSLASSCMPRGYVFMVESATFHMRDSSLRRLNPSCR